MARVKGATSSNTRSSYNKGGKTLKKKKTPLPRLKSGGQALMMEQKPRNAKPVAPKMRGQVKKSKKK